MSQLRVENETVYEETSIREWLEDKRDSSWDWPSAMATLGISASELYGKPVKEDEGYDGHTMHPDEEERECLKRLFPNTNWDDFDLIFDT